MLVKDSKVPTGANLFETPRAGNQGSKHLSTLKEDIETHNDFRKDKGFMMKNNTGSTNYTLTKPCSASISFTPNINLMVHCF